MSASNLFLALGALALTGASASAQSADVTSTPPTSATRTSFSVVATPPSTGSYSALLVDNGPFVNLPGGGAAGADASQIVVGSNTFGYGHQQAAPNRVADDFTVPASKLWTISDMTWHSYQTGATTGASTFTAATVRVWSGPTAGVTLVAGDTSTNRLTASVWSGCYRVNTLPLTETTRPIFRDTVDMSWCPALPAGQYWVDVAMLGTLASGPWANIMVPANPAGNASQAVAATPTVFNTLIDGTIPGVEFPFKLNGTESDIPVIYCTAKVNSLGCIPAISTSGIANPITCPTCPFTINTINVLNNKPGLYLYSDGGQVAVPFFGGFRCVGNPPANPIRRSVPMNSLGNPPPNDCSGIYSMDWNAFANGALGGTPQPYLLGSGNTIQVQAWGRDPGFPAGFNATLSDAVQYVVE